MRKQSGFALLYIPYWVNFLIAGLCYFGILYGLPLMAGDNKIVASIARSMAPLAPYLALFFVVMGGLGAAVSYRRRRIVPQPLSDRAMHDLTYDQIRNLATQILQRENFHVSLPPEGSQADLYADAGNRLCFVHLRFWRESVIGADAVDDIVGFARSEGATDCIIVSAGTFAPDAIELANRNGVRLVEGKQLATLVAELLR